MPPKKTVGASVTRPHLESGSRCSGPRAGTAGPCRRPLPQVAVEPAPSRGLARSLRFLVDVKEGS
eukprot:5346012-Alexandrium_andersonii.AAC.1